MVRNEYDDYGRPLGLSYFDVFGDLTISHQPGCGYASLRNTYDKYGRLVPIPQGGGNAKRKAIYDADGYLEAVIAYDSDDRIMTSIYNTVDERGRLTSTMMLDHTFGDLSRYDAITGEAEVFYANSYEDDAEKVRLEEEYRHLMDSIETLAADLYE